MGEIKLDLKDKKIITALSLNARAPLSEVAKAVGLSKQVVKYRLENLQSRGVIEGYYTLLNINKLGYMYHRVFLKFQNVDTAKENEIIDFCKSHKKVGWIAQIDGRWDLGVVVWAKDAFEFEEVFDEITEKYGQYFEEKLFSIDTAIYHFKHKFLLGKADSAELVLGGIVEETELDKLDYKILGVITKNARESLLEIAKQVKSTPNVVKYRIDRMVEKGVILGFQIKLNHKLLGYTHQKVFLDLKTISRENVRKVMAYIKSLPSSVYITKAVGASDIEFEVMVKSNEEFHELLRGLRYKFAELIKSYSAPFLIYHEPYINYLPMMK